MEFGNTKIQSSTSSSVVLPSVIQERPVQFDIWEELDELSRGAEWQGRIVHTVLAQCPDLQITLTATKARTYFLRHHNRGWICVQTVQGHIRKHAEDKLFDLPQGKALVLEPGITHDVETLKNSAFLLIVAPPAA